MHGCFSPQAAVTLLLLLLLFLPFAYLYVGISRGIRAIRSLCTSNSK